MKIYNLASGSSGNCTLVCSENTRLLVDAGVSMKYLCKALSEIGLEIKDLSAIALTHEHIDHIKGIGAVSRKYALPIYATGGTIYEVQSRSSTGIIPEELFHFIKADEAFEIEDLRLLPIEISHDAAEPIALRIEAPGKKMAVVTDLGCFDSYLLNRLEGLDAIVLESNHDISMLQSGKYPFELKRRILGAFGHLSNISAAELVGRIWHEGLKNVILGHLSRENNLPELALKSMENAMLFDRRINQGLINIRIAPVNEVMETYV